MSPLEAYISSRSTTECSRVPAGSAGQGPTTETAGQYKVSRHEQNQWASPCWVVGFWKPKFRDRSAR